MKRKLSIQKGFVYGVTAIAVLAVMVGLVTRFTSISADVAQTSNADGVSTCYRSYGWFWSGTCVEKMAAACTRTERLATKTASTPTAQEKASFGENVKAWDIGINKGNSRGKFRMTVSARRTGSTGPVRFDVSLTPTASNWGGNGDRIYLIFNDGLGYKKVYNYITKNTTWTSYINKEISTGDVDIMFVGENEDGCLKDVIDIRQALATVTPSPSVSPSTSPSVSPSVSVSTSPDDPELLSGVRGCYYNGKNFENFVGGRNENINFIWGNGPAVTDGDNNNFSVRWEGYIVPANTGSYTFKATYDDGMRLWIGGRQYINDWNAGNERSKETTAISMEAGVSVPIKVEYFEGTGEASAQLFWKTQDGEYSAIPNARLKNNREYRCVSSSASPTATTSAIVSAVASISPIPSPSRTMSPDSVISVNPVVSVDAKKLRDGIKADYFKGTELKDENLVATKLVKSINFNWGNQDPVPGLSRKDFSTRFTTKLLAPSTGDYSIGVTHNDGVKVWLGGKLIINKWDDWTQAKCTDNAKCVNAEQIYKSAARVKLQKGKYYDLKIEHFDKGGNAQLKLYWLRPSSTTGEIVNQSVFFTPYNPNPPLGTGTGLTGSYYTGVKFDKLQFSRIDRGVNFNWKAGGPRADMKDNFSVRWAGYIQPRFSETYEFTTNVNDGVKLWIDNKVVIDKWSDNTANGLKAYTGKATLKAGKKYAFKLEMYEKTGYSGIQLKWKSPSQNASLIQATQLYPLAGSVTSPSPTDVTKTFKPGFTGIYLPDSEKPQLTKELIEKGLSIYRYGPEVYDNSKPPKKTWLTAFSKFNHKIGYYVYNPGTTDVKVSLDIDNTPEESEDMMVFKGWNLLANSSTKAKKLSDLIYDKRICSGATKDVNCAGFSKEVNFGKLTYGWKGEGKEAYRKMYVLNDPRATNQTKNPFTIIDVTTTGIGNVQIPAGKLFWIYFFE